MKFLMALSFLSLSIPAFAAQNCYRLIMNDGNRVLCIAEASGKFDISVGREKARCLADRFEAVKFADPNYSPAYKVTSIKGLGCGDLDIAKNSEILFFKTGNLEQPGSKMLAVQITTPQGTWSLEAQKIKE